MLLRDTGGTHTATDAIYNSRTGDLVLTILNHGLTTSNTIGIATDGLVFTCGFNSENYGYKFFTVSEYKNSKFVGGITQDEVTIDLSEFTTKWSVYWISIICPTNYSRNFTLNIFKCRSQFSIISRNSIL